jgi:hypothetical protein
VLYTAKEMTERVFGSLKQKCPKDTLSGSCKYDMWVCDCGNETKAQINNVFNGNTKSCGKCNEVSKDTMSTKKFGRLKQKYPKNTSPGSNKSDMWVCDCGKETNAITRNVFNGHTKSCGHCSSIVKNWYQKNKSVITAQKTPIQPGFILNGPIEILEIITNTHKPILARCAVCKKEYKPMWDNIRAGKSLTCGCTSSRTSKQAIEILEFIESLGFETTFNHKIINNVRKSNYEPKFLEYDVFVHSKNLLIEYDGKRWHEMKGSKERDDRKHENAINSNYEFIRIKEVEWKKDKDSVKRRLISLLD